MLLFQPHTLLLSWIVNVPNECYLLSLKVVQTVLCINPKAPTSIYKFSRLILHCLIEVVERICLKIKAFSWRFSFHPSSETQGQSVGSGEKARRKFSSTSGRAPGYRLSPDHFQTVKRMLAPDWAQKILCIIVPNGRTASPEFFSWVGTRLLFLGLRGCISSKKQADVDQSTKTSKQYFSGWRFFLIIYDVNFNSIYFRNIFATLGLFKTTMIC